MTTPTRELLIMLSSHMAYMQGQLEAFTQQSDPEDFYWYRESVALRQKVIDALAEPEPKGPTVMEIIELADETEESGLGQVDLVRAALARWGRPARAADLLERQAVPVPVAVSECPWEREGWCDDEGRCWAFNDSLPAWEFLSCTASRKWADLFLPFDALPLPSGEVE